MGVKWAERKREEKLSRWRKKIRRGRRKRDKEGKEA